MTAVLVLLDCPPEETGPDAGLVVVAAAVECPPMGAVTPPVNPHAAASRLLKPLGFARTGEIRMLVK
jgi:hypothetical protein